MNKQEYIATLGEVVSVTKEAENEIGDRIYRVDIRHTDGNELWYTQERVAVINEEKENETAFKYVEKA
jgi:hypothetical protein